MILLKFRNSFILLQNGFCSYSVAVKSKIRLFHAKGIRLFSWSFVQLAGTAVETIGSDVGGNTVCDAAAGGGLRVFERIPEPGVATLVGGVGLCCVGVGASDACGGFC